MTLNMLFESEVTRLCYN